MDMICNINRLYIKNVVYLLIAEGSRLVDVQDDVRVVVVGSKFNITTTAGTLTGVHIHCAPQSRRRWLVWSGEYLVRMPIDGIQLLPQELVSSKQSII